MYICLKYDLHVFTRNGQKSVQIEFARICLCLIMTNSPVILTKVKREQPVYRHWVPYAGARVIELHTY